LSGRAAVGGALAIGPAPPNGLLTVQGPGVGENGPGVPGGVQFRAADGTGRFAFDWANGVDAEMSLYGPTGAQGTRISATADTFLNVNGGSVGVGTLRPFKTALGSAGGSGLHVKGGAARLLLEGSDDAGVNFQDTQGPQDHRAFLEYVNGDALKFTGMNDAGNTPSDNILVLSHGGNVGIGTPHPGAKLDVNGGLQLESTALGGCDAAHRGTMQFVASAPGNADLLWFCMKSSGNAYDWRLLLQG
ncbi:MAG: hypothetical protein LC624_06025, partial [Halobacteriales archaeon]|nr:hypothetical protein [Halobacteriales archaeon]